MTNKYNPEMEKCEDGTDASFAYSVQFCADMFSHIKFVKSLVKEPKLWWSAIFNKLAILKRVFSH